MKDYILSRLAERSTWAGLLAVLGAFGVWNATPEQASAITALALAIMGGFSAAVPDRMPSKRLPSSTDEPEGDTDPAHLGRKISQSIYPDER